MKIPTFEEIQLNQACDSEYIQEKFVELGVGEMPIFIRTDKISREDFLETLPNIQKALRRLNINPYLPYPIVIITTYLEKHDFFPIVKSDEDLSPYFNIKTKKPSKKELQLLAKISMAKDKFQNLFKESDIFRLQTLLKEQRTLCNLTKELYFYENLKKKICRPPEKRNDISKK